MSKPFRVRSVGFGVCVVLGLAPWMSSCLDLQVNSGGSKACGDGIAGEDELCDDGNEVDGDGCDSNCTFTQCGNGVVTGLEKCDDGNAIDGDACTNFCQLGVCGDGILRPEEQCDDDNLMDGDGCDSNCTMTGCGNGVVTEGEQCDDGNLANGDFCDAMCNLAGAVTCGDNKVEPPEECDDGNTSQGDGCGTTCLKEHPDVCPGTPIQLLKGEPVVISGSTVSATDKFVGSSAGVGNCMTGNWAGSDLVYAVTPSVSGTLSMSLDASYGSPFLHVRLQCPGTKNEEIACRYATAAGVISDTVSVQAGTTYYVAVDSWNNNSGSFKLTLAIVP